MFLSIGKRQFKFCLKKVGALVTVTNHNPDPRLDALRLALEEHEEKTNPIDHTTKAKSVSMGRDLGRAYRVAVELVVGCAVGTVFGVWLDGQFNTSPLWLLIMMVLGFTVGIWNVYRWMMGYDSRLGFRKKEREQRQDVDN